jgi:hypothetical protein
MFTLTLNQMGSVALPLAGSCEREVRWPGLFLAPAQHTVEGLQTATSLYYLPVEPPGAPPFISLT